MGVMLNDVCREIDGKILCGSAEKAFDGVYVGDLLSRAMSHVEFDNLWVTIMSNINVIAVAVLTEPAAVILAENVRLDGDAYANAVENGITVITSPLSTYEICAKLNKILLC